MVCDFVRKGTGQPHECISDLVITDGNAQTALSMFGCVVQIEAGAKVPEWPGAVIGSGTVKGIDNLGRFWVGRSGDVTHDGRSLHWEFAVSDQRGLSGLVELAKWFQSGR
jgi:hypothetical protein